MISFDDFSKLDLRIGTIESAEDVPGKDKLLKLSVNLGEETRTILSGIKQWYSKEELVGKQIVVVANLEPKILAGFESQGMLLAADVENSAVLLLPDKKVPNGSKVR